MAASRYIVGKVDDFEEGERLLVNAGGREIVVFRQQGEFYALLNRCPHRGAPLCKGRFVGNITADGVGEYVYHTDNRLLACPWHGWEFDITTGQSYFDPSGVRTRNFSVEIEPGSQVRPSLDEGEAAIGSVQNVQDSGSGSHGTRVPGPYEAETYDVEIDGEYIVLRLRANRRRQRQQTGSN